MRFEQGRISPSKQYDNQLAKSAQTGATARGENRNELSRLITAAVVSAEFRNLLLHNPALAISAGYNGERFNFPPDQHAFISSIRAESLQEFARQLIGEVPEPGTAGVSTPVKLSKGIAGSVL